MITLKHNLDKKIITHRGVKLNHNNKLKSHKKKKQTRKYQLKGGQPPNNESQLKRIGKISDIFTNNGFLYDSSVSIQSNMTDTTFKVLSDFNDKQNQNQIFFVSKDAKFKYPNFKDEKEQQISSTPEIEIDKDNIKKIIDSLKRGISFDNFKATDDNGKQHKINVSLEFKTFKNDNDTEIRVISGIVLNQTYKQLLRETDNNLIDLIVGEDKDKTKKEQVKESIQQFFIDRLPSSKKKDDAKKDFRLLSDFLIGADNTNKDMQEIVNAFKIIVNPKLPPENTDDSYNKAKETITRYIVTIKELSSPKDTKIITKSIPTPPTPPKKTPLTPSRTPTQPRTSIAPILKRSPRQPSTSLIQRRMLMKAQTYPLINYKQRKFPQRKNKSRSEKSKKQDQPQQIIKVVQQPSSSPQQMPQMMPQQSFGYGALGALHSTGSSGTGQRAVSGQTTTKIVQAQSQSKSQNEEPKFIKLVKAAYSTIETTQKKLDVLKDSIGPNIDFSNLSGEALKIFKDKIKQYDEELKNLEFNINAFNRLIDSPQAQIKAEKKKLIIFLNKKDELFRGLQNYRDFINAIKIKIGEPVTPPSVATPFPLSEKSSLQLKSPDEMSPVVNRNEPVIYSLLIKYGQNKDIKAIDEIFQLLELNENYAKFMKHVTEMIEKKELPGIKEMINTLPSRPDYNISILNDIRITTDLDIDISESGLNIIGRINAINKLLNDTSRSSILNEQEKKFELEIIKKLETDFNLGNNMLDTMQKLLNQSYFIEKLLKLIEPQATKFFDEYEKIRKKYVYDELKKPYIYRLTPKETIELNNRIDEFKKDKLILTTIETIKLIKQMCDNPEYIYNISDPSKPIFVSLDDNIKWGPALIEKQKVNKTKFEDIYNPIKDLFGINYSNIPKQIETILTEQRLKLVEDIKNLGYDKLEYPLEPISYPTLDTPKPSTDISITELLEGNIKIYQLLIDDYCIKVLDKLKLMIGSYTANVKEYLDLDNNAKPIVLENIPIIDIKLKDDIDNLLTKQSIDYTKIFVLLNLYINGSNSVFGSNSVLNSLYKMYESLIQNFEVLSKNDIEIFIVKIQAKDPKPTINIEDLIEPIKQYLKENLEKIKEYSVNNIRNQYLPSLQNVINKIMDKQPLTDKLGSIRTSIDALPEAQKQELLKRLEALSTQIDNIDINQINNLMDQININIASSNEGSSYVITDADKKIISDISAEINKINPQFEQIKADLLSLETDVNATASAASAATVDLTGAAAGA